MELFTIICITVFFIGITLAAIYCFVWLWNYSCTCTCCTWSCQPPCNRKINKEKEKQQMVMQTDDYSQCTHIEHPHIKLTEEKMKDKILSIKRVFLYSKRDKYDKGLIYIACIGNGIFEVGYEDDTQHSPDMSYSAIDMEDAITQFNKWCDKD